MNLRHLAAAALATVFATACVAQTAAPAPRQGTDYEVIATPQPTFGPADGKIEVAEVFSYHCIHCADAQPFFTRWARTVPADVRFTYVHAAFGGAIDNLARGFYAAEALGAHGRTHEAMFKAFHVDRKITSGSMEEIADVYAGLGLDRQRMLDTMNSFGITSKLNRARQFALRTGVNSTPTVIVAGKYRVMSTRDRGFEGMLQTINALIARERAARPAPAAAAAPAAAPAR